jgi:hypothetical protein
MSPDLQESRIQLHQEQSREQATTSLPRRECNPSSVEPLLRRPSFSCLVVIPEDAFH